MNKEQYWQVCDLESAIRLKELKVKQESLWYWRVDEFGNTFLRLDPKLDTTENLRRINERKGSTQHYSAFTVAEFGIKLNKYRDRVFCTWRGVTNWHCFDINDRGFMQDGNTEANAKAEMLIYLLENKIIKDIK